MYYQELTLLPAVGTNIYHLWGRVYKQLHLALASQMPEQGKGRIGVSFPQYEASIRNRLGCKLRLFAEDKDDIQELDIRRWLKAFSGYVHIMDVKPVPVDIDGYAVYRRVHQEESCFAKARRYAKRHDISYEDALRFFPETKIKDYPFIRMDSETNKNSYCITIGRIPQNGKIAEGFGSFGLDDRSTVPEF